MQIVAWAILITCELLVASIPTVITARILEPFGRAVRGYEAFGVERLIVAAVFCIAYALIHKTVCDKLIGEG